MLCSLNFRMQCSHDASVHGFLISGSANEMYNKDERAYQRAVRSLSPVYLNSHTAAEIRYEWEGNEIYFLIFSSLPSVPSPFFFRFCLLSHGHTPRFFSSHHLLFVSLPPSLPHPPTLENSPQGQTPHPPFSLRIPFFRRKC